MKDKEIRPTDLAKMITEATRTACPSVDSLIPPDVALKVIERELVKTRLLIETEKKCKK